MNMDKAKNREKILSEKDSLQKKTLSGAVWSSLEKFSAQGISFLVMIVMARILTPTDYGLVGMVLIFVHIALSLVDCGFSQALIRKQDRTELDNNTAFYFNIVVGVILYAVMWFIAPAVSEFYRQPRLVWIMRAICLGILFNSFVVVQRALLTVEIDFKTQAKASIYAAATGGVIGIWMAYKGLGVWSIVAYHIINFFLNTLFLWIYSNWRPMLQFSWKSFSELFGFGSKLAASGLIHTLYNNAYIMVIGKFFQAADLGFYSRADQFAKFLSLNISNVLQRVTFPVLCRFQDDNEKLSEVFLKFIRATSFIIIPLMAGMAAVSKPFILALLGDKWLFVADLLPILCFSGMLANVYTINQNILLVKGRSDLFLRLEIFKKIFFVLVIVAAIPLGLLALCWAQVINSVIEVIVNSFYTKKLIGISIWKQLKSLVSTFIYSFSMAIVVWIVTLLLKNCWLQLFAGVGTGLIFFYLICYLTRSKDLRLVLGIIKRKF